MLYRDAIAVVTVLLATAMRLVFLSALGTCAPFVVFYPAVIVAALYGGRRGPASDGPVGDTGGLLLD